MNIRLNLSLFFVFFLFAFDTNAQMHYMPDSMLRVKLTSLGYGSCITGDSINQACPAVQNTTYLDISSYNIHSLEGLDAFTALNKLICGLNDSLQIPSLPSTLDTLICNSSNIVSLPVLPAGLIYLDAQINDLSSLVSLPNTLQFLNVQQNHLSSIPNCPDSLKWLNGSQNQLTSLPALSTVLYNLVVEYNQISSLPSLPSTLHSLNCSTNLLSALPSLPANLTTLYCSGNSISVMPGLPSGLTRLDCGGNQLTSLPSLPTVLIHLSCEGNQIASLPQLPNSLGYLSCSYNVLTSLPTLPNSLANLDADHNQITTLPALPTGISQVFVSANLLTSLPTLPAGLMIFKCGNNNPTTLPLLPNSLTWLECMNAGLSGLPPLPTQLSSLECSGNYITSLPDLPANMSNLNCSNNPLTCLPRLTTISQLNFTMTSVQCLPNYGTVSQSFPALATLPLCDIFNPNACDVFWNISGKTFFDSNNDCVLNNFESGLINMPLKLSSNGTFQQLTYTGGEGFYSFDVNSFGNYSVELDTTNIPFNVNCPAGGSYFDTLSVSDSTVYSDDFALKCRNGFDVGVWSVVPGVFRPNHRTTIRFSAGDWANFFGVHCATGVSGTITVLLNGPVHYYGSISGFITPSATTSNTVTYNINNFGLISSTTDFAFEVETDTTAMMGSSVCIDINVQSVAGDYNQSNNSFTNCFTVQASFDPNDKVVYPEGSIDTTVDWLTYTIRFQNTGSAFADNIYILDTLDANLDATTFQLLATSHQSLIQLLPGNIIRFNFPNIDLPDSTLDEEHSHGYVQYKIKLKDNLAIGTQIRNTAYIYFDFNQPVVTNTTFNQIDLPNAVSGIEHKDLNIKVYPQPFSDELIIESPSSRQMFSIADLTGRVIYTGVIDGRKVINTSVWSPGIYVLKASDGTTIQIVK